MKHTGRDDIPRGALPIVIRHEHLPSHAGPAIALYAAAIARHRAAELTTKQQDIRFAGLAWSGDVQSPVSAWLFASAADQWGAAIGYLSAALEAHPHIFHLTWRWRSLMKVSASTTGGRTT